MPLLCKDLSVIMSYKGSIRALLLEKFLTTHECPKTNLYAQTASCLDLKANTNTLTGGLTILKGALFDQFRHFESRLLSLKFACLSPSFLNFSSFH